MADDASIMQRVVDGRNHSVFLFEKSRECGHQLSHPFEEEEEDNLESEDQELPDHRSWRPYLPDAMGPGGGKTHSYLV